MSKREQIIERIKNIDDPDLLNELDRWLNSLVGGSQNENFSKDEIAAVREGYEQYSRGEVFNQEKANELFDEWLQGK